MHLQNREITGHQLSALEKFRLECLGEVRKHEDKTQEEKDTLLKKLIEVGGEVEDQAQQYALDGNPGWTPLHQLVIDAWRYWQETMEIMARLLPRIYNKNAVTSTKGFYHSANNTAMQMAQNTIASLEPMEDILFLIGGGMEFHNCKLFLRIIQEEDEKNRGEVQ